MNYGRRKTDRLRAPDGRRASDVEAGGEWWRRFLRENWYRDVWLVVITALWLVSVKNNSDRIEDIQASRVEAYTFTCERSNRSNERATAKLNAEMQGTSSGKRAAKALIDELSPFTDNCEALAHRIVGLEP